MRITLCNFRWTWIMLVSIDQKNIFQSPNTVKVHQRLPKYVGLPKIGTDFFFPIFYWNWFCRNQEIEVADKSQCKDFAQLDPYCLEKVIEDEIGCKIPWTYTTNESKFSTDPQYNPESLLIWNSNYTLINQKMFLTF